MQCFSDYADNIFMKVNGAIYTPVHTYSIDISLRIY